MKTVSQRELRNDNAALVREVEAGESYVVTRRGVPVARLVPFESGSDLRCERPARGRLRYSDISRVSAEVGTAEVVEDLRGER